MGTLIAKTKGRNGGYFKLLSDDEDIFELPDDIDEQSYDANYILGEGEWYAISNFSEQEYCPDYLKEQFNSVDYNQLSSGDYQKVDHFFEYRAGTYFYQKVPSTHLIRKSYLQVSQSPRILKNRRLITVETYPAAIYFKRRDVMIFKNLSAVTTLFKGIDELYKEATSEEVEEFLGNNFIELQDDYLPENVKKANRKRISSAMKVLEGMSRKDRKNMFGYVQEYCPNLPVNDDGNAFAIGDETSLKHLLYGIEERFYTTPRSKEKRLANSVRSEW